MRILIAISENGRLLGESHPRAKLSDAQIEMIRDDHEYRGMSVTQIASKRGIPWGTVNKIVYYNRRASTPVRYITREIKDGR